MGPEERELARYEKHFLNSTMCTHLNSSFQGDSGGTLQSEVTPGVWMQIGIVSFGPDNGCGNRFPNGYSRISHLLDFVSNVTGIPYF
jgi:secreted trypsin-like serine protease